MTALDAIAQARERLGDIKKQRWSDNRLLAICSMGNQDICKQTNYIRKITYMPLVNKNAIYQLPSDCYRVSRVEYKDTLIPLYTRDDKDFPRNITTDFIAFKSNLDIDRIELYPAPKDIEDNDIWLSGSVVDTPYLDTVFGVVTGTDNPQYIIFGDNLGEIVDGERALQLENLSRGYGELFDSNKHYLGLDIASNYGVIVEASNTQDAVYGFINRVLGHIVSNEYGLIADVGTYEDSLKLYYVAIPEKLRYMEANLAIPDLWEDLIVRYIVGTALQDDNDANNIQRGDIELQKYQMAINKLRAESAKDFSGGAKDKLVVNYRRI
jgi:hypothetical protein